MEVEGKSIGLGFPCWKPLRRRFGPEVPFFDAGNLERELLAKQVALDLTEADKEQIRNVEDGEGSEVFCPIVGCRARLKSLGEFEDHHNARHLASCSVCSRVYPTARLLSIHVSEAHDSFFQAKVSRGFAMYECLVEGCGAKLMSYKNRQQHLVDKHKFPTSFDFKKAKPSQKHRQKLSHKSAKTADASSTTMQVDDDNMDTLISAVSRLSTSESPSSISFGRRHTRGLAFTPRAVQNKGRKPDPSPALKN